MANIYTVFIILATYLIVPVNSVSIAQTDEFKAEGLTEPVVPEPGEFEILVGVSSSDIRLKEKITVSM